MILFNHIPRTGGTTLRVILNRVYGEDSVFFINSRDVLKSVKYYKSLSEKDRSKYKVISGHGAEALADETENTFRITILRDPISLFVSQYRYLRESQNSNFLEDVKALDGFENYLNYALAMGQDNMMTRFLATDPLRHIPNSGPPPPLDKEGEHLLQEAKNNLSKYDLVIGLSNFDQGIYQLSILLDWNSIPLYRPRNRSDHPLSQKFTNDMIQRLNELLRFDIRLYEYFKSELQHQHTFSSAYGSKYHFFSLRQNLIRKMAKLFNFK